METKIETKTNLNAQIEPIIESLQNLRQSFCEIENARNCRSILSIDRIDAVIKELKTELVCDWCEKAPRYLNDNLCKDCLADIPF